MSISFSNKRHAFYAKVTHAYYSLHPPNTYVGLSLLSTRDVLMVLLISCLASTFDLMTKLNEVEV
jgi:hypothetical protein